MRQSLICSLARLAIVNLHGSSRAGDGSMEDENVFDIMQGVAVLVGVRRRAAVSVEPPDASHTFYADLIGRRSSKYSALSAGVIELARLAPSLPYYLLRPLDGGLFGEYEAFVSVEDAFGIFSSGIETEKDHFAVEFEAGPLRERLREFCDASMSSKDAAARFGLKSTPNWDLNESRKALAKEGLKKELFLRYLFHCFDWRYTYYSDLLITRSRRPVMRHMSQNNLALVCLRQVKGEPWAHAFVTTDITNKFTLSSKSSNVSYHFPLFLTDDDPKSPALLQVSPQQLNLRTEVLERFATSIGAQTGVARDAPGHARRVFFYMYAVLHSPQYRLRYSEYLRLGFPRIPLPGALALFRDLARLGGELVALHLVESPKLDQFITTYTGPKNPEVGRVGWSYETVWLDANATKKGQLATPGTIGFRGVPEAVWNFHIGGYKVCEKWLKDRKGCTLSDEDITHYNKMVVALAETIRLMKEIDEVIEQHGGWPGALQARSGEASSIYQEGSRYHR
jgi:predicted helicase